jgi:hypothetical protein
MKSCLLRLCLTPGGTRAPRAPRSRQWLPIIVGINTLQYLTLYPTATRLGWLPRSSQLSDAPLHVWGIVRFNIFTQSRSFHDHGANRSRSLFIRGSCTNVRSCHTTPHTIAACVSLPPRVHRPKAFPTIFRGEIPSNPPIMYFGQSTRLVPHKSRIAV